MASGISSFNGSLSKRRKISHPVSPPLSGAGAMSEPSPQIHQIGLTTTPFGTRARSPEETPRADPPTATRSRRWPPPPSPSLSASRTVSQASGYSSPSKDFNGLELDPEGVQTKALRIGTDD